MRELSSRNVIDDKSHDTSISLKIGMVALKKRKAINKHEEPIGDYITSPSHGHEIEFLIDQIKSLQSAEA